MNATPKIVPKDPNGVLHVMLIGRVSTPEQQLSNIEAGYEYAKQCLRGKWDGPIEIKAFGEQASGLLIDRITMLQAYEQIEAGWPDIMLMEDVSKAYRNPRFIFAIFQDCYDANIRGMAPGDSVDTADENWELMLQAAAMRHGMHIPETRRRIRRTATYSFHQGGMVLRVRFGYRRLTKDEAATGQFGPRGLRIVKVDEQTPIIRHIREWIVRDQPSIYEVLAWFVAEGIPPGPYVKSGKWSLSLLLGLLRDPILYGLRVFRRTVYKCIHKTGKYLRNKNTSPDEEHCPTLAHMTKEEWEELQAGLKNIGIGAVGPSSSPSPRFRVARSKSVLPLQFARCAICGKFVYLAGYDVVKCQNSLKHKGGTCWNHVQIATPLFREKIVDLILDEVKKVSGAEEVLKSAAFEEIERVRARKDMASKVIDREIKELEAKVERIGKAIELGQGDMESLVKRLKPLAVKLKEAQIQQERQMTMQSENTPAATKMNIDPRHVMLQLAKVSFEFADLVRKIIPECTIRPVQSLDSGQVRGQATIKIDLSPLMPHTGNTATVAVPVVKMIDLYEPPVHIKHLSAVVALVAAKTSGNHKSSLTILARELKIGRMTVKRALAYHRLMVAEGLSEPYRVLTASPSHASRWKSRKTVRKDAA